MNYSSLRYYIEIYFYPMECVTWQHQNWLGRDRLSKKGKEVFPVAPKIIAYE